MEQEHRPFEGLHSIITKYVDQKFSIFILIQLREYIDVYKNPITFSYEKGPNLQIWKTLQVQGGTV